MRHPAVEQTLGRALRHRRVEPVISTLLRAGLVHGSLAFAVRELTGRRSTHVYRVRESGLLAAIEHQTADVHALDQAFYQHAHEPPPKALATLRSLGRPLRALDLGAHIGMWGLWLQGRFPVERVVGLEPDPRNAAHHRRQIELNDLQDKWELIQAAAVRTNGTVAFSVGQATNGRVTTDDGASTASVCGRDAFALLKSVDLLKIDIEGGEWSLLDDPRARSLKVPVIMLEHHLHDSPSADPRRSALEALERAGYTTEAAIETSPGFGVVWGCRAPCESG